ncbi:MAG TPA: hypothetical protein VFO93_18970 [Hymenobacter sp.]|uniref:hypothetical protein n=1 Tax=Hymenobacter sp. TaxID=1898978 RepID=UPI002D8087AB|nr:hypothetical protein [Hymenobacter sp.]HET9505634.1 hypothetical protein [Hymenobacter sp.]
MELPTIRQTYLLPATSQAINKALATLAALGLAYEEPHAVSSLTEALLALVVEVPTIPVVHRFELIELRHELVAERNKRTDRPSHREARGWNAGPLAVAYPDSFFSSAGQEVVAASITDLVVRERIIQHFATQGIVVHKITLSKPAAEALGAGRFFPQDGWYAFAEEARPALPELATLLGAVER